MTQPDIGCNILRAMDELRLLREYQDLLQLVLETENVNPAKYQERLDMVIEVYLSIAECHINQIGVHLQRALEQASVRRCA